MVTILCTQKLLKLLGKEPLSSPSQPTNRLGGWYANVIETPINDAVIFTSEVTLVSVFVPLTSRALVLPLFVLRVQSLLQSFNLPMDVIKREMSEYSELVVTRTASRNIVSSMNQISSELWVTVEMMREQRKVPVNLSEAESLINSGVRGVSPYIHPDRRTRELLMN